MNDQVLTPEIIIDQCNEPLVPFDAQLQLKSIIGAMTDAVVEYQHFADTVTVNNEAEANAASLTMTAMANDAKRITQAIADQQARKERERLAKEAARLKTPELKQEREEQAAQVIAPQIMVAAPKSTVRMQTVVTCEITDITEFVKAAAVNSMLCGYIDQASLAAALKKAKQSNSMLSVAGVKFGTRMV
jgi:hypothetical protein